MTGWRIDRTNAFKRQHKRLSYELQQKTDEVIMSLYQSEQPHLQGRHKTAKFNCLCGYDLGRRYRLLYEVDLKTMTIFLRSVGIHDTVY